MTQEHNETEPGYFEEKRIRLFDQLLNMSDLGLTTREDAEAWARQLEQAAAAMRQLAGGNPTR